MGLHLILAASDSSWGAWTLNVVLVLVGLNLVILVHELGHFLVARRCGVRCEKFYIWFDIFGWKLFKFTRGDTEYGIGVLPLGGYVKMLGQEDNPARLKQEIERAKAQNPNPSEPLEQEIASAEQALYDPKSYLAKSVPTRMAIISAGVIMNVLFALAAAVLAYGLGVEHVTCAVGEVFSGEAAWQANLRPGDVIDQIGGRPVQRFDDLQRTVSVGNIDQGVPIVIRRPEKDGTDRRVEINVFPDRNRVIPTIGISPCCTTSLREDIAVLPGSPAALARPAFRPGDRFVRIGDVPITSYARIHALLAEHADERLKVTVQRAVEPPEGDSGAPAVTKEVTIEVAPAPMRRLGLVMGMGRVTAVQDGSPAARAGIQKGDRIERVDGQPPVDPMTLPDRVRQLAKQKSKITLSWRREGEADTIEREVSPRPTEWYSTAVETTSPMTIPALGIAYRVLPRVADVQPGTPAAQAGLQRGDEVVHAKLIRANPSTLASHGVAEEEAEDFQREEVPIEFDEPEANWPVLMSLLQETLPGTQVELTLKGGRRVTLTPIETSDSFHPQRGFIFETMTFTQTARSLPEAVALGSREAWESLTLIFRTLRSLGTGQVNLKALSGPVGIFHAAVRYASRGFSSLLIFLCLLSANLAVLNFIPIPVLDGGHMIFLGYEGIRGKPASEGVLTTLTFGGLIFILALMIWVTGMDISRLF